MDRELWVLMAGFFATNAGYFMVIPLVSVYATRDLRVSVGTAGLVVAVTVGVQKSLGLGAGLLADRLGRRRVLLAGLVVRVAGLLAFVPARSGAGLLLAGVLVGLGGAGLSPPIRAGLAARVTPDTQQALFAGRALANNLGAAVGPLLGALLALADARLAFVASAAGHAALAAAVHRWVGDLGTGTGAGPARLRGGAAGPAPGWLLRTAVADRLLWRFSGLAVLFTILYSQLTFALPLRAGQLAGDAAAGAAAASLFTVNAVAAIAMQAGWLRYGGRLPAKTAYAAGGLLCAVGVAGAGLAPSLPVLYAAVVTVAAGEVLAFPAADALLAGLAPAAGLASYYGVFNLSWAAGAALGSGLAGWALSRPAGSLAPALLWVGFLVTGVAVAAISQTTRWTRRAPAEPTAVALLAA